MRGIGKPSQACEAMEMGAAAIMANTAIATAGNVPEMASAFKLAIEAGRKTLILPEWDEFLPEVEAHPIR